MTPPVSRRRFLIFSLIAGLAAGCRPVLSTGAPPPQATSGASPGTLQPGMRFVLENDSIAYAPHPRGCDVTSVRGSVRLADGSPLRGMIVRIWADDPAKSMDIPTGEDGLYGADLAKGTPHTIFHLQLLDPSKQNRLSDVIVAEATGSCNLNYLTVNFVPASP